MKDLELAIFTREFIVTPTHITEKEYKSIIVAQVPHVHKQPTLIFLKETPQGDMEPIIEIPLTTEQLEKIKAWEKLDGEI